MVTSMDARWMKSRRHVAINTNYLDERCAPRLAVQLTCDRVPRLLHALVTDFAMTARDQGFELALASPEREAWVLGESDALKGLLLNLLDNAMKYSEQPHEIELERAWPGLYRDDPGQDRAASDVRTIRSVQLA